MSQFRIDIHCHSQMKPFAKSFGFKLQKQSADPNSITSLWFDPGVTGIGKLLNNQLGLTKFRQANLRSAAAGNVQVLVLTLGCVEKGFVQLKGLGKIFEDVLVNLSTGFGEARIAELKKMNNYWVDYQKEIQFLVDCNGTVVYLDKRWLRYKLVDCFASLNEIIVANQNAAVGSAKENPFTIAIIPSVEGLHVLNADLGKEINEVTIMENLKTLKTSDLRPWFVTLCHHFDNGLVGHARSFKGFLMNMLDQTKGMNEGFSPLGKKVVDYLLSDKNGKPIFIDLKHLSIVARKYYIDLVNSDKYKGKVPLIISHGVANGLEDYSATTTKDNDREGRWFFEPTPDRDKNGVWINVNNINFFDSELMDVIRSEGIIGLQLDERRIANTSRMTIAGQQSKTDKKFALNYSELVWAQIQYIARLADRAKLPAWEHIAIGSDFDGIIDPLNKFWSFSEYGTLEENLLIHARRFIGIGVSPMNLKRNRLSPEAIVDNIMQNNAWNFFQKWF